MHNLFYYSGKYLKIKSDDCLKIFISLEREYEKEKSYNVYYDFVIVEGHKTKKEKISII